MSGLTPPTHAQISQILPLLEDNTRGAIFMHCKRGADRTGSVIAAYRIDHNHWSNVRALAEAMSHGMSIFQIPRQGYILAFEPRTILSQNTAKRLYWRDLTPAGLAKGKAVSVYADGPDEKGVRGGNFHELESLSPAIP
jgi:hypothetical protein